MYLPPLRIQDFEDYQEDWIGNEDKGLIEMLIWKVLLGLPDLDRGHKKLEFAIKTLVNCQLLVVYLHIEVTVVTAKRSRLQFLEHSFRLKS